MIRALVPLMKPEDPVLWGLLAVVAVFAVAGAYAAWRRGRVN